MIVPIRFIGSGGQGNVLAAYVLGNAAVRYGLNAVQTAMYSAQVRGAPTRADVIISNEDVYDVRAEEPTYLIVMSQSAVYAFKNTRPKIVIAESNVSEIPMRYEKLYKIDAINIAKSLGSLNVQNMVFLGFLVKLLGIIPIEVVEQSIRDNVSPKWADLDIKALREGYKLAEDAM